MWIRLVKVTDPGIRISIRIRTKMSRIQNTGRNTPSSFPIGNLLSNNVILYLYNTKFGTKKVLQIFRGPLVSVILSYLPLGFSTPCETPLLV